MGPGRSRCCAGRPPCGGGAVRRYRCVRGPLFFALAEQLLQGAGQGVAQELTALVEQEQLAAVEDLATRRGCGGALEFHGEGEGLLDELTLEVGLRDDGEIGHQRPPCL